MKINNEATNLMNKGQKVPFMVEGGEIKIINTSLKSAEGEYDFYESRPAPKSGWKKIEEFCAINWGEKDDDNIIYKDIRKTAQKLEKDGKECLAVILPPNDVLDMIIDLYVRNNKTNKN